MTRRVRNKFPAGYNLTFASRKSENILRMNRRVITNFTAPPKLLPFSHFSPSVSNLQWNSNYTKKSFPSFLQYNQGKDDFISFNAIRVTKRVLPSVKGTFRISNFCVKTLCQSRLVWSFNYCRKIVYWKSIMNVLFLFVTCTIKTGTSCVNLLLWNE